MRRAISVFIVVFVLSALLLCPGIVSGSEPSDVSNHFHAVITSNKDVYTSGETAIVSIKYTVDEGTLSENDYIIVTVPEDIASHVAFTYSHQHFSGVEELGEGRYRLIFGPDAATALSGSMNLRITMHADDTITDKITLGDADKEVTVIPQGGGESGVGDYSDEAIMKDGLGNSDMDFGGYDYSDGDAVQIGLFDSSADRDFVFRLYVNRKNVSMENVIVTDTLPDGMYFNGGPDSVKCTKINPETMTSTGEEISAGVSVSGQQLKISLNNIDYPVQIEYGVHVPAQSSVYMRNHSEILYTQDGKTYKEHKDYIVQSNGYSAANGVKSVDKTVVSDDPKDQWVTYTIRFWNDNGFAAGEINLTDDLDDNIKYLFAEDNDTFQVTADGNDPSVLHISNIKDISTSMEAYVSFVCDFSEVPVGYTVYNTVGGNVTRTDKISGSVSLKARKTVDGKAPKKGGSFRFELLDKNHRVLRERSDKEDGSIDFGTFYYGKEDLGQEYIYYAREKASADGEYIFDESEYMIKVKIAGEADESGIIAVQVSLIKNGEETEEIVFNNQTPAEETSSETVASEESETAENSSPTQGSKEEPSATEPSSQESKEKPLVTEPSSDTKKTMPSATTAKPKPSETTSKPGKAQKPDTSDNMHVLLWRAVAAGCAICLGIVLGVSTRKR